MPGTGINNFKCSLLKEKDLEIEAKTKLMRVIVAHDGELLTNGINIHVRKGKIVETDPDNDLLKIVVKDRYRDKPPSAGFIRGFELREGAFASSVAHDSHNIVAIGTNDSDLARVINEIVRLRGGLAAASGNRIESLQLNIGGIMSTDSCREVSGRYNFLNELVKDMGCTMKSPFMTMSFMALLVIPELKIGDHGLFDVNEFKPVSMFI
jgi:adenine deaminase